MSGPPDPDRGHGTAAKAGWELNAARQYFAARVQADYGKWLLVTLTATHLSAIYLISRPEAQAEIRENPAAYWPFVMGIIFMLLAGLLAWTNWTLAALMLEDWLHPGAPWKAGEWPAPVGKAQRYLMTMTFWLPVFLAALSVGCIPWGAAGVLDMMPPQTQAAVVTVNLPAAPWPTSPTHPAEAGPARP